MAVLFARLRLLFAVLLDRPIRVSLPVGRGHFFPRQGLVLPVISGADGADEGDEEDASEGDGEDADAGGSDEEDDDGDGDAEGGGTEKTADDYRKELRKSERRWKRTGEKNKTQIAELEQKLKDREDEDKSEQEKAVEKAKEEGRSEALTEAQKERRKDRLESAVTRAAAKKIKIGEGDDAKTVRFDDPEDAEIYLQRKIAKGDLDEDDLFDDAGKPKADVVAEALAEILEEKPRLAEDSGSSDSGKSKKTADGDADQGKGKSAGSGVEDMSVEDHVKRMSQKA